MTHKQIFSAVAVAVALLFASCSVDPKSSGNPYEVMVVAEDSLWNSDAGENLRSVLETPMEMLPQPEPMFHVSHVTNRHYDRITQLFRNIIVYKVDPHYAKPRMQVQRDVFSSPQVVMTIVGPSAADLASYVKKQKQTLLRYFSVEEINREATRLAEKHNIAFDKEVMKMFGCHLYIPVDLKKMKVGENFIWASDDGLSTIQNIVIYSYPYATRDVFRREAYIALRNHFMENIPGRSEGSVMSTNDNFVEVTNTNIRGNFTQEARGLWEMTGEAMGGPFIAHSQVDTISKRVIVVEGFVYAPNKMKRTMLRRLEGALYTLELPAEVQAKKEDDQKEK